jgi:hypothetical protein
MSRAGASSGFGTFFNFLFMPSVVIAPCVLIVLNQLDSVPQVFKLSSRSYARLRG